MDRGAIVSRGWDLMLKNKGLWGAAAIILIIRAALQLILPINAGIVWALLNIGMNALFSAFLSGTLICMVIKILEQHPGGVVQGYRDGLRWLPPLFVLHFLLVIPSWLLSMVIFEPILNSSNVSVAEVIRALAFLFLVQLPISALFSAILIGAERAAILESHTVGSALMRGGQLLRKHLGDYWGIGVRLVLITLAGLVVFGCGIGILRMILHLSAGQNAIEASLATTALDIFLSGFVAATWTLAFREWQVQERSDLPAAPGIIQSN